MTADKPDMSLPANTIMAKLTNRFQRARLIALSVGTCRNVSRLQ